MEIEAQIDYHGPGIATFDPQKVLERLSEAFPVFSTDYRDLAQEEVERIVNFLDTRNIPEPSRSTMLRQIRDKAARNGPVYTFQLDIPHQGILNGKAGRYHVLFRSERVLDAEIELTIIRFLQSLHLGTLTSDTRTSHFQQPRPDHPGDWVLGPESEAV